jgi:hypothetical protein
MMRPMSRMPDGVDPRIEAAAEKLIGLIDEFIAVVTQENAMLAQGLPASLSSVTKQKHMLADAFELWVKAAQEREFRIDALSEPTRKAFVTRLEAFQHAMSENLARLEAAMEASRRRIDAVMTAIRTEMTNASPYGANGKRRSQPSQAASLPGNYF